MSSIVGILCLQFRCLLDDRRMFSTSDVEQERRTPTRLAPEMRDFHPFFHLSRISPPLDGVPLHSTSVNAIDGRERRDGTPGRIRHLRKTPVPSRASLSASLQPRYPRQKSDIKNREPARKCNEHEETNYRTEVFRDLCLMKGYYIARREPRSPLGKFISGARKVGAAREKN